MINNSSWPKFDKKTLNLTSKIIRSGKVNYWSGNYGKKFEEAFRLYHNRKYSVAVSSGTAALDIAIKSLNLKKNEKILTTPRSYYASSISIINNGLKVVFADIDKISHNLDPDNLITNSNILKNIKAILIVHLGGIPCDMEKFQKIRKIFNIKIIEDCSQAHGAIYKGKPVGSFGDVSIWSFCNDKIISTLGEGGMIVTNNRNLYKRMWSYKEIGKNFDKFHKINFKKNEFKWVHDGIGSNARMTEIQAAAGLLQLNNLGSTLANRKKRAEIYIKILNKYNDIKIQFQSDLSINAYYRLYFTITSNEFKKIDRDKIISKLNLNGVEARVDACPSIFNEKYFRENYTINLNNFKNTIFVGDRTISLKVDETISMKNIIKSSNILDSILQKYFLT